MLKTHFLPRFELQKCITPKLKYIIGKNKR